MAEKIYVVSVGVGSSDYLTEAAEKIVAKSKFLAGGERNLRLFDTSGKEVFVIRNNLADLKDFLQMHIKDAPAVLASGDAGFYGVLSFLKKHFPEESLEVIPGISSMQLAFAKLKESWHDAAFFSIHGRDLEAILPLLSYSKVAVLTDTKNSPQTLARFLVQHGVIFCKMAVLSNLGYDDEIIWKGNPTELVNEQSNFKNSVVVIFNDKHA